MLPVEQRQIAGQTERHRPNPRLGLPLTRCNVPSSDVSTGGTTGGGTEVPRPCLFSLLDLLSTEDCTTPTQRAALRAILQDFLLNKLTQERVWSFIGQVIGYQVLAECIKHLTAKQSRSTTADSVNAASLARIDSAFGICSILGATQSQLAGDPPAAAVTRTDTTQTALQSHAAPPPSTEPAVSVPPGKDTGTTTHTTSQPQRDTTTAAGAPLAARIDSIRNIFSNMEWTNRLPSFQTPRLTYGQATVLFENKFFILGGLPGEGGGDDEQDTFSNICIVNVWDLQSRIVPTYGTPPPPLAGHSATLIEHPCTNTSSPYILVYGGIQADNNTCNDKIYKLDLVNRVWTEIAPAMKVGSVKAAPLPRTGHSTVLWPPRADAASRFLHSVGTDADSVLLTEMLIVYGGKVPNSRASVDREKANSTLMSDAYNVVDIGSRDINAFEYLNDMWVYNLSDNSWTEIIMTPGGILPEPRACSALFWRDDCTLCLYGGESVSIIKTGTTPQEDGSQPTTTAAVLHSDVWNCNVFVRPVNNKSQNSKLGRRAGAVENTAGIESDTAVSADSTGKSTDSDTTGDADIPAADIGDENNDFEDGSEDRSHVRKRRRRNSDCSEPVDKQVLSGGSPEPAVDTGDGTGIDEVEDEGIGRGGVDEVSSKWAAEKGGSPSCLVASHRSSSDNSSGAVVVMVGGGDNSTTSDSVVDATANSGLKTSKRRRVESALSAAAEKKDGSRGAKPSVCGDGTTGDDTVAEASGPTEVPVSGSTVDGGVAELTVAAEWHLDDACSKGARARSGHSVFHLKVHDSWSSQSSAKNKPANILLVLGGVTTRQVTNTSTIDNSMNDDTTSSSDVCTGNDTTGTNAVAGSDSLANTTSKSSSAEPPLGAVPQRSKLIQCCTKDIDVLSLPTEKETVPYDICLWSAIRPRVGFSTFEDVSSDDVLYAGRTQATVQFFVANAQTRGKSAPCVFVSAGIDEHGKQLTDSLLLSLTGEDSYSGLLMDHSEFIASSYASNTRPSASTYRHVMVSSHHTKPESKINSKNNYQLATSTPHVTGVPTTVVLGHGIAVDGLATSVQAAIRQTPLWLTRPVITPGIFWSLGGVARWALSSVGNLLENSFKSCVASTKVSMGVEKDLNQYAGTSHGMDRYGVWIQDNGVGLDYQSLHKLLKKVSSFTPGDRQTRSDVYGMGFKLACSRLSSSCMVITRTKSVVGAGMLSQRLLSHFDSQVVVAPVCMWRLPKREIVTCGFPCADLRHAQRTLMSYSPFSSPTVIAGEMNKLGHLTGTRIVFWDIRKDLPYLQRDENGVVVLRSHREQQNITTAAPQRLPLNNTAMAETQNVPTVSLDSTGASTDTVPSGQTELPASFPLWTKAEYALDHCLPTYLFWSFLKRMPDVELNGAAIEVPACDTQALKSTADNHSNTHGDPSKCLHDYLKLRLHKMVELPYLRKPSELDSYGLVGFLNRGDEAEGERVCEAGILLYYRGRLIRRLNARIPNCSIWDMEQSLLTEEGKAAHIEEQRRLNGSGGGSIVVARNNDKTFDWRNNITAVVDVPSWLVPACNKETFVQEGSDVWNAFVESVESMLCDYWHASESPEKLAAFSELLRSRLHSYYDGAPNANRRGDALPLVNAGSNCA